MHTDTYVHSVLLYGDCRVKRAVAVRCYLSCAAPSAFLHSSHSAVQLLSQSPVHSTPHCPHPLI